MYLSLAGYPIVVFNTHQAATDLLDRRSAIYSDRPRNIVASELLTRGLMIVLAPYNEL